MERPLGFLFLSMNGNDLKDRFIDLGAEDIDIPDWYKEIVRKRIELYQRDPGQAMDFEAAMDRVEKNR